jgi:hypothetical protein
MDEYHQGQVSRVPHIKGVAIRGALMAIDRRCPPGTRQKMVARLADPIAPAVEHESFLAAGWYPLVYLREIYGAALAVTGRELDLVRELSREATLEDFRGIYRFLTFVLSPEFLIRRAPGLFSRYYDTGSLSVPEARPGHCRAVFIGCRDFDLVLWEDVIAGACAILEACGAKDIRTTRVRGGDDGDTELELIGEWD